MFNSKKGSIMRHPYATLLVIGLATAGALSIGEKIKSFCSCKTRSLTTMMGGIKNGSHYMENK